jgi:hypothetical protein
VACSAPRLGQPTRDNREYKELYILYHVFADCQQRASGPCGGHGCLSDANAYPNVSTQVGDSGETLQRFAFQPSRTLFSPGSSIGERAGAWLATALHTRSRSHICDTSDAT